MKNDTFERIKSPLPRLLMQHVARVLEARLPTMSYAGPAEIDILGMVFVTEPGCQQLNDMHAGRATVRSEFLYCIAIALMLWKPRGEPANHVAHAVGLRLPNHMAWNPARILNVLVPMKQQAWFIYIWPWPLDSPASPGIKRIRYWLPYDVFQREDNVWSARPLAASWSPVA
jgi:hypothetical protein